MNSRVVSGTGVGFGESEDKWEGHYLDAIAELSSSSIHVLDLAPNYGSGNAEILAGNHCASARNVQFMTKLSLNGSVNLTAEVALQQSLERLQRPSVEYLCTHWSGTETEFLADVELLLKAKTKGLAKEIGLGNPSYLDLLKLRKLGVAQEFSFVQSEYSLCDSSISQSLEMSHVSVSTIFGYSPLCEGQIAPTHLARQGLTRIATQLNVSDSALMLRWLMQNPLVRPITRSRKIERHTANLESSNIILQQRVVTELTNLFSDISRAVPLSSIRLSSSILKGPIFTSEDDARKNTLGVSPSPDALAEDLRATNSLLKPLRVIEDPKRPHQYLLTQGHLRYWAAVLAFGLNAEISVTVVEAQGDR